MEWSAGRNWQAPEIDGMFAEPVTGQRGKHRLIQAHLLKTLLTQHCLACTIWARPAHNYSSNQWLSTARQCQQGIKPKQTHCRNRFYCKHDLYVAYNNTDTTGWSKGGSNPISTFNVFHPFGVLAHCKKAPLRGHWSSFRDKNLNRREIAKVVLDECHCYLRDTLYTILQEAGSNLSKKWITRQTWLALNSEQELAVYL